MASPHSSSTVDYQAWEAQMDRATQSPHLNPPQTMTLFPSRYAYSSRPPSMTSEEAPSPSQCISVHTPGQLGFADPQPTIDDHAGDDDVYGGYSQYGRLFDLRGTSPSYYENSTFLNEGGSVLDPQERNIPSPSQKYRSQIPGTSPALGPSRPSEEPWSSLNTRVGNSLSQLHQLLSWQNGSGREQIHVIDAQHDGHLLSPASCYNGYPPTDSSLLSPATVASISPYGTGLSDQQYGLVDELCERNWDLHSGMPHTQNDPFDWASTATYGPNTDLIRPVSRIDRRSEMESNLEPDTFHDNSVLRFNQTSIMREQLPIHHDSPTPLVYGYQANPKISYRQHLDICRGYLPYHRREKANPKISYRQHLDICRRYLPYHRRETDTRAYQTPNNMTSPTQSPDTQLVQSPLLRSARARQGMVGPVRTTALAIRAKGVRKGPLKEDARRHARDTRGEGSCWPCKIQRYKCDADCGSEKCFRCERMRDSPWRWGCIRDTLPSYANGLLAASLLDQHNPQQLTRIFRAHIHEWSPNSIDIHVKWAHGPPIQVVVHEFRPIGTHLLFQDQYILSQRGYERVQVSSLPVGMTESLLKDWRPRMIEYLDRIVDEPGFEKFPENCFRGDQNEVQRRLIHAFRRYKDAASDEGKRVLRNSLKLLVCQKLASYSLILDEQNKNIVLDRMHYPSAASAYGRFTASRFLNREIKSVVADLHRTLLDTELKNLQEALQASDTRRLSWGPAFVSVLILGMVTEVMQHLVRCKASSDIASVDPSDSNAIQAIETRATVEINKMEDIVEFTRALFDRKYLSRAVDKGKGFKPIFKPTDRDLLDEHSKQLALDVNKIICENGEFLEARQKLGPPNCSDDPRVSRLVAEFLLSCKPKLGAALPPAVKLISK